MTSSSSALLLLRSTPTPSCKEFILQRFGGYRLLGTNLGKGSFARVELAVHLLTRTKVALKIINIKDVKELHTRKNVLRESSILKTLRHKNVVRLYETLVNQDTYCFVTEYLEGGNLYNHMKKQIQKKFTEKQSRSYFVQLLYAVQYLHKNGIIHRDLKLRNIMLEEDKKRIKIVDFGLSNYFDKDDLFKTRYGSTEYAAPELFDKCTSYGPSIEIWSMGVILFAMTTGKMPFQAHSKDKRENFIIQIRKGMSIVHENILRSLNTELKQLIIHMLEPDLGKRVNLPDVISNVWVTEYGKNPPLSQPAEFVPHEIRKRVIEKVAELYDKPVPATIKDLNVNRFDAIHATYQILLDKSVQRSSSVRSSSIATPNPKKLNEITKFSSRKSSSAWHSETCARQTKASATTKRHVRPQSARPELRIESTLDNQSNERFSKSTFDKSESLVLMECDDDESNSFEMINDDVTDSASHTTAVLSSPENFRSMNSAQKITPPRNSFFSADDLQQTPISQSKIQKTRTRENGNNKRISNDGDAKDEINFNGGEFFLKNDFQKTESNVIESIIEGVFKLNSSERDNKSKREDTASGQLRMAVNGYKISSGSFKVVHESNKRTTSVRKHSARERSAHKTYSSERKPSIRCLSPYEARKMLHRDTFPLKHTLMNATSYTRKDNMVENKFNSGKSVFKADQVPSNLHVAERKLGDKIIANMISRTPISSMSINGNKKKYSEKKHIPIPSAPPTSRCSLETADEILSREKYFISQTHARRKCSISNKQTHISGSVSFKE